MTLDWSARELSALALAYMGDAVWEVYARNHVLNQGIRRPAELHRVATRYVRARAQAWLADRIFPHLTEPEQAVWRRGRNAKAGHLRRSTDVLTYRHSTAFEAVLGYLYGTGEQGRLDELCQTALTWIDEREANDNAAKQQRADEPGRGDAPISE